MNTEIQMSEDGVEFVDVTEYYDDPTVYLADIPKVAEPLIKNAKNVFSLIENLLYQTPSFVNLVKANVPKTMYDVVLTGEQKRKLAAGTIKLMTKKDGSLLANLVNVKTGKIVSQVSLKGIQTSPALAQAMTSYATQMQLAQISEGIQKIQLAVEEVRQGQESDRLALAQSCQQKLLQASVISNPQLRKIALLRLVSDAEDSRNLLMLSQEANAEFIKNEPESILKKFISGSTNEKIEKRMTELRESLCAVNMVSFVEAVAYQELEETEAAKLSINYFSDFLQNTYLKTDRFVERLDLLDPSPENYWTQTLPDINNRILELPFNNKIGQIGEKENGREKMRKSKVQKNIAK